MDSAGQIVKVKATAAHPPPKGSHTGKKTRSLRKEEGRCRPKIKKHSFLHQLLHCAPLVTEDPPGAMHVGMPRAGFKCQVCWVSPSHFFSSGFYLLRKIKEVGLNTTWALRATMSSGSFSTAPQEAQLVITEEQLVITAKGQPLPRSRHSEIYI